MNSAKQLVIFDLWQTLVDLPVVPSTGIADILKLGVSGRQRIHEALRNSRIYISRSLSLERSFSRIFASWNPTKQQVLAITDYWKMIPQQATLEPGAEMILEHLRTRGYTLAILTNIDVFGLRHFRFPELFTYFHIKYFSCLEGHMKPSLKCWTDILRRTRVSASSAVMVGDSLEEDILPAMSVGLKTISIAQKSTTKAYPSVRSSRYLNSTVLSMLLRATTKR